MSEQLMSPGKRLILREDIGRIKDEGAIAQLFKLGRSHDLVNYNGMNFVMSKYQLPLQHNI